MATMQEVFGPRLEPLLAELKRRATRHRINQLYYDSHLHDKASPYAELGLPRAIRELKLKNSYRNLMSLSQAPWGSLIVDSVQDRLEVTGISTGNKADDATVWEAWQTNAMDAESKLGHAGALIDGRCYATVWPGKDGYPEIVLDDSSQMVMRYREGRHQSRHRIEALRYWMAGESDKQVEYATLYHPSGLYRFKSASRGGTNTIQADGTVWERYMLPDDEKWPAPNPFDVTPVVEIATNRLLKAGPFPQVRGEFEHCLGLIDQINLLTYLGLIVAVWMGFPLRGVTGMEVRKRILTDDEGNPLVDEETGKAKYEAMPPYESRPDSVLQATDPNAKFFQLDAADRTKLSPIGELDQLATITKTPRHYFPMDKGMSNLSADAIRASEGGLHAKVKGIHKPFLGEGWEEVLRVAGKMLPGGPVDVPPTAELRWADHESRSMAERADAATKVASLQLPWQVIASKYLNFTNEEIVQAESLVAGSSVIQRLLEAAKQPALNGQPELPVGSSTN